MLARTPVFQEEDGMDRPLPIRVIVGIVADVPAGSVVPATQSLALVVSA